jgi:SAM-dependent methyltransferase
MTEPVFDAWYYAHSCGRPYVRDEEWLRVFGAIADRIAADIAPRTVLDAGCAIGLLVETLAAHGIDASGLDISEYAIAQAAGAARGRCHVASLTDELPQRYDLIVCIEVLEHMPEPQARAALSNICRHTDDVLFSSSPQDYGEATHLNVQPPEVWAEWFAREGFLRDLDYDASYITAWAVRYRRRGEPVPRVVREYERALARQAIERNELRRKVIELDRDVRRDGADAPSLREQLVAAHQRIQGLEDTVANMQRSVFWRLREVWVALRRLVTGGPR